MDIKCRYCNCKKHYYKKVGIHIGAYCSRCDKWIKWLSQEEKKILQLNNYDDLPSYVIDTYDEDNNYDDDCPF